MSGTQAERVDVGLMRVVAHDALVTANNAGQRSQAQLLSAAADELTTLRARLAEAERKAAALDRLEAHASSHELRVVQADNERWRILGCSPQWSGDLSDTSGFVEQDTLLAAIESLPAPSAEEGEKNGGK